MATSIETHVDLARIRAAQAGVAGIALRTPIHTSSTVDGLLGVPVFFKAENLQKTGSFKVRGAFHCLSRFDEAQKARGVVTASAGNHAQGIALGASLNGMRATVFMPRSASIAKVQATRGYGAEVRLEGAIFDEAVAAAQAHAEATGACFVSAFDHDDIITGQGTVALELLEQVPEVETVIVPVGGGGLMSGMAIALKESNPRIRVIGVQASGASALVRSWEGGSLVATPGVKTLADGIAIKKPAARTFHYIQRHVDEMVTVSEEEIASAIVLLLERMKLLVEGAGAVGLAAALSGRVKLHGPTAIVLSGGNIDIKLVSNLIERGMTSAGRYARLHTQIDDRPGALVALLTEVAATQANLIDVTHNRQSARIPINATEVELLLETRDAGHVEEVVVRLQQAGYPVAVFH